jgi:hypothetical protein
VERSGTSGKTLNFSHEWKKSQIFNKDECKYLFLRFNIKTKHVDFIHSFVCQCHVYYTKYYNVTCNAVNTHLSRVEEELHVPTLPKFTPAFSEVCIAQYVVFCIEFSEHYLLFCIFHVGHCVVSPHSTYSLWLIL